MGQVDSQIITDSKEISPKKPKRNLWKPIIALILVIALVAVGVCVYVKYYKIPYDAAVANYTDSVEQYNTAVFALEERNHNLDDRITALSSIIYADNIPIDDSLLSEANSVLEDARNVAKDSAAILPDMPSKIEEINTEAERILNLIPDIEAMGDYHETINLLSATEEKYRMMVEKFQGCKTEILWTGVDEESTVLRFVIKLINENDYAMRDVVTEWVAYDKNDAIVGSFSGAQSDIPANGCIYYVGGAGSANLAGTPAYIKINISTDGILTDRQMPQVKASNVQVIDIGFGGFYITADCITDSEIMTANLNGQVIVKDADGQIIAAEFWKANNLPDSISANGKFVLSEYFSDLPAMPMDAEVYINYVWQ